MEVPSAPNGPQPGAPTPRVGEGVPGPASTRTPQARPPAAPSPDPVVEHPGTQHALVGLRRQRTFHDVIADEEKLVAAGHAEACGHSCEHHSGGAVCIRTEHPDEEGNRVPHVGRAADGTLTQWSGPCTPALDEEIRQQVEAARLQAEAEQQAADEAKRAERQELFTDLFAAIGQYKMRNGGKLPWG